MSLKFAVFGTGFWSTLQIPAWFEVGDVRCIAVWNRTHKKALETAERYNIAEVYESAEMLLKKEKPDFVDIITEVPAHEELVLLCAKYKVPVICQKPMSFSYKSCEKMVRVCRKAQIPFYIHENWRYRAPFIQLKSILDKQLIGKIRRIEFNGVNGGRLAYNAQPFLKTLPHLVITDIGSHMFDLARLLFGEPVSIYCSAVRTYEDLAGENFMTAVLNYPDKVCTVTIGENIDCYVFLDGEEGTLTMKNDYTIVINKDNEQILFEPPTVKEYPWAEHTKGYLPPDHVANIVECNRTFLKAFRTGVEPANTGEENLKTMRLVYSACKSLERKKAIDTKYTEEEGRSKWEK